MDLEKINLKILAIFVYKISGEFSFPYYFFYFLWTQQNKTEILLFTSMPEDREPIYSKSLFNSHDIIQ